MHCSARGICLDSGHVAGAVFARLEIPERCVVLCPNHTGMGRALAILSEGAWETPLGEVPVDEELAGALKRQFPALHEDAAAHRAEHAIEVELPFLHSGSRSYRSFQLLSGPGSSKCWKHLAWRSRK